MKLGLLSVLMVALAGAASANPITIYGTGVGVGAGVSDPNYTFQLYNPGLISSGQAITIGPDPSTFFGWASPFAGTQFDSAAAYPDPPDIADGPHVQYDYTTTFDLTGLNPSTADILGSIYCDDGCDVYLNGDLILNDTYTGSNTPWKTAASFSTTSGFVSGLNTLVIDVPNVGGPGGMDLTISGTADPLGTVPEPGTMWLLQSGLLGVAELVRRTRLKKN